MKNFGEQFLHQKDSKLHTSQPVEHEKARLEMKGEDTSQKPAEKIADWLEVIEKTHTGHVDDARVLERIKNYYHKENVIKAEDVPESTFLLEQTIARNQGHGTIEITDSFREQKTNEIISNQEKSLDKWVDYLSSPDATYPMWAKYWAFNSMLKMGKMEKIKDKETKVEAMQFKKRTKDTVASFPTLNPRALAMTISAISAKAEQNSINKNERITPENISKKLNEAEFKELVSSENFSKIYSQFLVEMPEYSAEGLKETRGRWKTYKQGSEPDELVRSLDGHPLEWCTANIDTAKTQLQGGDFHVYYSINENGEAVIPRVAIRMQGNSICEVRGIAANQNMDPYISDVVKEKMTEFPDGEKYEKKSADMKRLTEIEEKNNRQEELSEDDLRFLYEINLKIEGFGYEDDPRIDEVKKTRNTLEDLKIIFSNVDEINRELSIDSLKSATDLVFPKIINGSLNLYNLKLAKRVTLPESINGNLHLDNLQTVEDLILPKSALTVYLGKTAITFPQEISYNVDFSGLKSAIGLKLPEIIKGNLNLRGLSSVEGLALPNVINGNINFTGLKTNIGLSSLGIVECAVNLRYSFVEKFGIPNNFLGEIIIDDVCKESQMFNLKCKYPNKLISQSNDEEVEEE